MRREPAITLKVAAAMFLSLVEAAVNFYDHAPLETRKVDDEWSDRNLAAKSVARDLAFAQQLPKSVFTLGRRVP